MDIIMELVHIIKVPIRQYILVTPSQVEDLENLFEKVQQSFFESEEPYKSAIQNVSRNDVWFLKHKGNASIIIVVILNSLLDNV